MMILYYWYSIISLLQLDVSKKAFAYLALKKRLGFASYDKQRNTHQWLIYANDFLANFRADIYGQFQRYGPLHSFMNKIPHNFIIIS